MVSCWNGTSRNLRSYRFLKCQAIFPPGGLTIPLISGCWSISFAAGIVGMCYLRQHSTTHHLGWRPLDLTRLFLPFEADSSFRPWVKWKQGCRKCKPSIPMPSDMLLFSALSEIHALWMKLWFFWIPSVFLFFHVFMYFSTFVHPP